MTNGALRFSIDMKVLKDLKRRVAASRVLRRAQTALILFILFILAILLQTRELLRASRPLKSCELRFSIDMKVLKDLKRPRCCSQSLAPRPNRSYPGHPDNPGHPASDAREIKGLTALEKLRVAFFYRHEGPKGPEEAPLLQPEPRAAPKSLLSWPS